MIDSLDRRIAELQREERETHRAYMMLRFLPYPYLDRAVEIALFGLECELDVAYRERDAEWAKDDDRILRDVANGYNPSEL